MGRGSVVALGFAASAGAFLLAVDALRSGVFVDVGRANICGTKRTSMCFVAERGVVEAGDGRTEMRVRRGDGRSEDVVAIATFILVRLFRGRRPPWRLNEEAPPSLSG